MKRAPLALIALLALALSGCGDDGRQGFIDAFYEACHDTATAGVELTAERAIEVGNECMKRAEEAWAER